MVNQRKGGKGNHVMHGRSRMTIDPLIPTLPGRSTSGFHRPGRHCLPKREGIACPSAKRRDVLGESRDGSY